MQVQGSVDTMVAAEEETETWHCTAERWPMAMFCQRFDMLTRHNRAWLAASAAFWLAFLPVQAVGLLLHH